MKIKIENNSKILIIRKDNKIGDMIVNTLVFGPLKKKYNNLEIGVLSGESALEILKNNPHVDKKHIYKKGFINTLKLVFEIRKNKYNIVVDFDEHSSSTTKLLIKLFNIPNSIGYNKGYEDIFSDIIDNSNFEKTHITEKYIKLLEYFDIFGEELDYEIFVDEKYRKKSSSFYFDNMLNNEKNILLNRLGADSDRTYSVEKTILLLDKLYEKYPNFKIVMSYMENRLNEFDEIIKLTKNKNVFLSYKTDSILQLAALVENANIVISPDTSIIHIASAFKRPVISLNRNDSIINIRWAPFNTKYKMLVSKDDNINSISAQEVARALEEMLEEDLC